MRKKVQQEQCHNSSITQNELENIKKMKYHQQYSITMTNSVDSYASIIKSSKSMIAENDLPSQQQQQDESSDQLSALGKNARAMEKRNSAGPGTHS